MLSSDDFFGVSRTPQEQASKRAKVEESEDDILALLDEIDAVTATCDTFTTITKHGTVNDPFQGHSLSQHDTIVDEHQVSNEPVCLVNTTSQSSTIGGDLLPHPFTADVGDPIQAMTDSARALQLLSFTVDTPILCDYSVCKVESIHGFIIEYERVGRNYRVTLLHNIHHPPVQMTCQGSIFTTSQPCHYGMLLLCKSVTCFKGHAIVTLANVEKVYNNYHTVADS